MRFKHLNSAVVYNSINLPAEISGIQSAYTLIQGQDTVITAVGTDPEGDALTWSFEEVAKSKFVIVGANGDESSAGAVYVYDANNLSATPTKLTAFDGATSDYFGFSVATAADKIVVGARLDDNGNQFNAGSVYVYDANNLSAQPTKLTAFDGATDDFFGQSVAVTADKIVVSAVLDDSRTGSVYVYDANNLSAQPTKLTAYDGAENDNFGSSVVTTANKIIIGAALGDGNATDSGSVYVYDANNLSATPTKLTAFDGATGDYFGYLVAATSDKIVVGATSDESRTGSVYVYDANNLSDTPTKLTAFDGAADDSFGGSVAATADKIIVGATGDDDNGSLSGSVYVYDANNLSATPTKLTAFDGAADDYFGVRVSATADKIIVGASGDDDNGSNSGSVYVYDANNLSATPTKLTAFDGAANDAFGYSIAINSEPPALNGVTVSQSDNVFTITPASTDANFTLRFKATDTAGNVTTKISTFSYDYVNNAPIVTGIQSAYTLTQGQDTVITATGTDPEGDAITWSFEESGLESGYVIVGAYGDDDNGSQSGSVYVYDANDLSATPTKLTAFDATANDRFGVSVAATTDKIIVGAYHDDDNGEDSGSVYVYDVNNLSATPTKLTAFDGAAQDQFGFPITATADKIVVSARGDDDNGSYTGSVYVYDVNNLSAQPTKLTAFDGAADDVFGDSIAATNDKIVVSAYLDDDNGTNSGSVYIYDANNLSATPTKLTAFDGAQDDFFGSRVSVTDDKIIVSAYGDDEHGERSGSVYVYDANNLSATPTKLTAFDGDAYDYFGYSIATTSNKIIIGAHYEGNAFGDNIGAVYVYDANNLSATPTKLTAFDRALGDFFGSSVSSDGDKIFVGAYGDDDNGSTSGSFYVYDANNLSATPTKLTAFDGTENDNFGFSIATISGTPSQLNDTTVTQSDNVFTVTPGTSDADFQLTFKATDTAGNVTSVPAEFSYDYVNQAPIVTGIQSAYTLTQGQDTVITAVGTDPEGDAITWSFEEVMSESNESNYVVVGAYGDDTKGSVYVYDANNLSATPTKLTAFDGAESDYFGQSVAATDDKIFVGARLDDDNGNNSGSVYVYDANNLSATPTKLTAFDGAADDQFGRSITATADKIFVGASGDDSYIGAVYVYDANNLSAQPTKLTAFDGAANDQFGSSIVATSDKIVVSAHLDDDNGENSGSIYVYDANNLSATPTKLTAFDGAANDYFGGRVAATSDKIVVSAYGDDDNGSNFGSVYVYDANNLSATPTKLTAFDGAENDQFGRSVSVTTDKIIVGAPYDDDNGNNSGSVYVYDANNLSATPTKLTAFDGAQDDWFGWSVTIIADKIIVGNQYDDDNGSQSGSVYVYDANNLSATPTKLTAFDGAQDDYFGHTVAAFSNVTSQLNDTTVSQSDNVFTVTPGQQGADFQLTFKATDTAGNVTSVPAEFSYDYVNQAPIVTGIQSAYVLTQGQDAVITAVGTDPEGDALTWSFEESGLESGYVVVGAFGDESSAGSVYVYDANNLSATPTKLTAFDGATNDYFGYSVATAADKIIVGAYYDDDNGENSGSVYVYDANNLSATPTKLTAFDGAADDRFGYSVSATADKIFVGAWGDDEHGERSGSVYVYDANNLSATPTKLTAFDGAANDYFGASIATTANKIIVSAFLDDRSGSVYVYDANNLSATPTKLTAFDGAGGDFFGYSVVVTADKIIVGSRDDDNGEMSGSVYVYDVNNLSATPTKLTAFDATANDRFGVSVAATTDKIIVGAYHDDTKGSVYVYNANNLSATPTKLTAFDGAADDRFGYSVSSDGDKIFVGAYGDESNTGAFYVYDANDLSAQPTKLTAFDGAASDYFGHSVAVISGTPSQLNDTTVSQSDNTFTVTPGQQDADFQLTFKATDTAGNVTSVPATFSLDYVNQAPIVTGIQSAYTLTQGQDTVITATGTDPEGDAITWSYEESELRSGYVIVSAYGDDDNGSYTGSVYVYDANNLSAQPTKLTAFDGAANDYFGISIATTANKIIVGAFYDDDNGENSGSVYVYDANNLSATPTKLTAFDGVENDRFGHSIAATDDKIFVAAYLEDVSGSVYVYDANNLSAQPTKLTAFDGAQFDSFGRSVAVTNDKIFVGASGDDDNGFNAGSVYVYDANNLSAQPTKLTAFDGAMNGQFGSTITVDGDKIFVGAQGDDDNGTNSGSVYVYDTNNLSATPTKLTAFDGAAYDLFGASIATTANKIIIGATLGDGNATDSGSVYVYDVNNLSATPTKLTAFDGAAGDQFGQSITTTADKIIVGASGDDDNESNTGSVYVYDANNLSATPTKLTAYDGAADDYFGQSVATISGTPSQLNGTTVSQSDNVFTVTPGQQDADFRLTFKATDTAGNVTTVPATFALDYVNQAPVVTGIQSAYTLTQGQDTVITATGTDPEGDAITWSFEEVMSESNYVVVGAYYDDSKTGSVYVYDANNLSAQPTKLTAFDGAANDYFGWPVAVTTDKIVVAAWGDESRTGAVYVYDINNLSATPTKLTAFDGAASDLFGYSVSATADKIIVGAPYDDSNTGSVYVYDANNLSAQPTKLTAFDGATNDYFGRSVSVTADKIIVGAPYDDDNGSGSGSVYVYDVNNLSATPTKLTAFDAAADDFFGGSIAATADKIIVGAYADDTKGSVYVYNANNLSATPTKLTAFDGAESDYFGYTVSATNDKIFVGAYGDDDNGEMSGSVYVYDVNNLSATPTKLTAFDGAVSDYLGLSVAATDDKIFVGAIGDDDNGENSGSVYVYDANNLSATPTKLTAFDGAAGDNFSVSIVTTSVALSQLNDTTVSQSDNMFTVTPGTSDADFQLTFKATDTAGNVTSVPATFAFNYQNQAPSVTGIQSAYVLTQGQDAVITAVGTDPEGDAITWSYEVVSSTSQDQLFVSAVGNNSYQGSVYVYNPTDLAQEPTLLTAPNGSSSERFGFSMEIDSDKIYIGELTSDESGETMGGAVYIYDRSDLSAAPTMLLAPSGEAQNNLRFGSDIFVNDNLLIIGAYGWGPTTNSNDDYTGKVYIYNKSDLSLQATLTPTNGDHRDYFGHINSVAVTPNHILLGAFGDDDNSTDAGAVYVYDVNTYAFVQKLTAPDASESHRFGGYSIKTYDGKVYISATGADHNGDDINAGAVYVYNESDLSFVEKLVAFDAAEGNYFGVSVLPHEDKLFVGASSRNSNTGGVYVYNIDNLSATPTVLESPVVDSIRMGYTTNIIDDKLYVSAHAANDFDGGVYVYSLSDLSATPTLISPPTAEGDRTTFGYLIFGSAAHNPLNGTTVSQSDNVFTVTTGQQDADFQLKFKATDTAGNTTTTTSDFTVVPPIGEVFPEGSFDQASDVSVFSVVNGFHVDHQVSFDINRAKFWGLNDHVEGNVHSTTNVTVVPCFIYNYR